MCMRDAAQVRENAQGYGAGRCERVHEKYGIDQAREAVKWAREGMWEGRQEVQFTSGRVCKGAA